jgi:3-phenylpropionate/trans-cinnamate dioxygenase ferredoxin reductase component
VADVDGVVIVGGGHAGVQVADSLRAGGRTGPVTVVADEHELPYQRPPLSKDHLAPGSQKDPLPLRGERFFDDQRVELRAGVRAVAIDRRQRTLTLSDGAELPYSSLVLATGAAARPLPMPGHDLDGVHELRTIADARRLRVALEAATSVVVVGAGFIGLEFAAAARAHGAHITVLEAAPRALARALSVPMSEHLANAHVQQGTDLRLGVGLAGLVDRDGRIAGAVGTDGTEHPADLVLLGIGVRPRDDLAREAGITVDDGIVVDEHLRTSDPHVYAVGDCARFPTDTGLLRLESVQNATDQARHVADVILGRHAPYDRVPWFWSNQGPLRLQIAGLTQLADTTALSGDPSSGRFSVLSFHEGQLVAVESLNRPADHIAARRLLASGGSPTPDEVDDPAFSLKAHAAQPAPS